MIQTEINKFVMPLLLAALLAMCGYWFTALNQNIGELTHAVHSLAINNAKTAAEIDALSGRVDWTNSEAEKMQRKLDALSR